MTRRRIPAFLGAFFLIAVGSVALLVPAFAILAGRSPRRLPRWRSPRSWWPYDTGADGVARRAGVTDAARTVHRKPRAGRGTAPLVDADRRVVLADPGNLMLMYVIVTVIQSVIQFGFQMISVAVILADSGSESTGAMLASMSIYLLGNDRGHHPDATVHGRRHRRAAPGFTYSQDGFDLDLGRSRPRWPPDNTPVAGLPCPDTPVREFRRATQTPYGQTQVPYGQTQMPYGQTQVPYGQTQMPYGQTQMPYGQAPSPYGQPQYGQPGPYPGQYPPYQQP